LLHHLDGELSLLRGDAGAALSSLAEAASLLPARGFCGDHVPIWYALARANLAAGRPEQAVTWLQRIAGASHERLCWPIPYARSLALLGRIGSAAGRQDEAAEAYARFLRLWGDGDLADAEQEGARRFLLAWKRAQQTASPDEAATESGD
jgi:tetratricopeptide (TPR) repeat protein